MITNVDSLADGVLARDTRALAKAITLLESTRADQRIMANALLTNLLPHSGNSVRLAISGSPGVGKSTFIEAIGTKLIHDGHRLAVLAVDPSSPVSGGSILGDRVRMENLARSSEVFIRPSPAGGMLGGTARRTRESIIACEAAGFDRILVETVGVGQSETLAASMTDLFVLLYLPNSGDEVQGIKRGILELADFVVITKCDGAFKNAALLAKEQVEQALMLTRGTSEFPPQVFAVSSVEGTGMDELHEAIINAAQHRRKSGSLDRKRSEQSMIWFRDEFMDLVITDADNRLKQQSDKLRASVIAGAIAPSVAAAMLAETILGKHK